MAKMNAAFHNVKWEEEVEKRGKPGGNTLSRKLTRILFNVPLREKKKPHSKPLGKLRKSLDR